MFLTRINEKLAIQKKNFKSHLSKHGNAIGQSSLVIIDEHLDFYSQFTLKCDHSCSKHAWSVSKFISQLRAVRIREKTFQTHTYLFILRQFVMTYRATRPVGISVRWSSLFNLDLIISILYFNLCWRGLPMGSVPRYAEPNK